MKSFKNVACSILLFYFSCAAHPHVNIVGYIKSANGLGRVTTTWIDTLSKRAHVNFIDTRPQFTSYQDIPSHVKNIALSKNQVADISILTDNMWIPNLTPYKSVPNSLIKFAYSMGESTKIPSPWVTILNKEFDGVIVPDSELISVYQNSGVTKPIFVLPIALYLEDFLKVPLKSRPHKIFTFGISAVCQKKKNIERLVGAFIKEYKNRRDVQLKIHTPWAGNIKEIQSLIARHKVKNISIHVGGLSWPEYIDFMTSLDCYVLISRGEGFSITVREAMALGLPCIISDNTAHKIICKTGLVYPVPSNIVKPSDREFYKVDVGNNFDCREEDVCKALRHVKNNYVVHLKKAAQRREWVKQYLPDALEPYYFNVVCPQSLIFGKDNVITKTSLMTNSQTLYEKYAKLSSDKKQWS